MGEIFFVKFALDRPADQIYGGKKEREKMQITPNEKIEHADASKILVYGASGAGKTTLIKTLVPLGKVLLLSAEAGLLSIRGVSGIDVATISSVQDLREAFSLLAKKDHSYSWVALDSISEIAEVVLTDAKEKAKDPRQAYGAVLEEVVRISRAFRDLPISVLFLAKEELTKSESGALLYSPGFPGTKLGVAIPYMFDIVARLVIATSEGKRVRFLQTQPDGTSVAKDRSSKLSDAEPADLAAIVGKMKS